MNRKHFISSLLATSIVLPSVSLGAEPKQKRSRIKTPPYLRAGDKIGISCPAGYTPAAAVTSSVAMLESWGFKVVLGKTVDKRCFTLGGTDEERAADFQEMLDDNTIKAILCARGGYGVVRILDRLNFAKFLKYPKWIIGFSDITAFHCHINGLNVASIHSKMCSAFPAIPEAAEDIQMQTALSIRRALTGDRLMYFSPPSVYNREGSTRGELVGGNLSLIANLAGSNSDLVTKGKILVVEDTGEYLYNIDRMFYNLKRSGKLSQLAGLIVGGFNIKKDTPGEEFGKTVQEIVLEKVNEYSYPVCFDFPIGHQKNNFAVRLGAEYLLTVNELGGVLQS